MNLPCLIHGVSDGRCGHCADCGLHVTLETDAFDNPMLYHNSDVDDDHEPSGWMQNTFTNARIVSYVTRAVRFFAE